MAKSSTSKLLYDEHPLVVNPQLAKLIGLNEAIVLQQVHYWVKLNEKAERNYQDGYYWTYNTYKEWQEQFPFWSYNTIRRTIASLEKTGSIVSGCFNKMRADKTKWYRVNPNLSVEVGSPCAQSGQSIVQKWAVHQPDLGKPVPETTPEKTTEITTYNSSDDDFTGDVFKEYESNIGRLTPIIAETLKDAIAEYTAPKVIEAIKVAAKANACNIRYIEGVLKRNGHHDVRSEKPGEHDPTRYTGGKYGHMVMRTAAEAEERRKMREV